MTCLGGRIWELQIVSWVLFCKPGSGAYRDSSVGVRGSDLGGVGFGTKFWSRYWVSNPCGGLWNLILMNGSELAPAIVHASIE